MREIKFRAWDKNSGTMFYGVESGVAFDDGSHYGFEKFLNPPNDDCHDWIVMQFTGLLDKNGKEIYEGDIVKIGKRGGNSPVVYMDGGPRVEQKNYREAMRIHKHGAWVELWVEASTCEVIGKIHENPELLQ